MLHINKYYYLLEKLYGEVMKMTFLMKLNDQLLSICVFNPYHVTQIEILLNILYED